MSIRRRFADPVRSLAHATGLSLYRARRSRSVRILMLHGIGERDLPVAAFRAQMAFVREHFEVIPLSGVLLDAPREAGAVALTFDDGLRNQLTLAIPVLRELRLPATLFVCPELIEEGRWQWNHDVRERLRSMEAEERREVCGEICREICRDADLEADRAIGREGVAIEREDRKIGRDNREIECLIEWMKSLPHARRSAIVARVRSHTPRFSASAAQRAAFDVLRPEDLDAFPADLITIGSHGMDHEVLSGLSRSELARQVRGSRELLEKRLGRAVEWFCYPNGRYDEAGVGAVRESYGGAVTMNPGFVTPEADPYLLPRIDGRTRVSTLSWRLHRPRR